MGPSDEAGQTSTPPRGELKPWWDDLVDDPMTREVLKETLAEYHRELGIESDPLSELIRAHEQRGHNR